MKKNLISALIPWKDLNNYNYETITFVDGKDQSYALRKFTDSLDVILYIRYHPECLTCTEWDLGTDSIALHDIAGYYLFKTNNYQLSARELKEIRSEEFDQTSTLLLVCAVVVAIVLIAAASSSGMGFDFGGASLAGP